MPTVLTGRMPSNGNMSTTTSSNGGDTSPSRSPKEHDIVTDGDATDDHADDSPPLLFHQSSVACVLDDKVALDVLGKPSLRRRLFGRFVVTFRRQKIFLFSSLVIVVMWSCACASFAEELHENAATDPGGRADTWLAWLEGAGGKFRLVGILFIFALVFRFNRCYDRWAMGRSTWGKIISTSLDATRMANYWMVDEGEEFADRFSRFVIVLAYATKALLRGHCLGDANEDGEMLIERGYLTREELDDINEDDGWEPHYCLDMLSELLIEVHYRPKGMMFDSNHKVHSQLFRAVDGAITTLGGAIGDAIRIRASGLPPTYDGVHHVIFYFYFILAPIFFAPSVGWALPMLIGFESLIIMMIIVLGSELIEPFGKDRVDLPLELFCETIEVQVSQIVRRSKRKAVKRFAQSSNVEKAISESEKETPIRHSQSFRRGVAVDHKKKKKKKALPQGPLCSSRSTT